MDRLIAVLERALPLAVLVTALVSVPAIILSPEGLPRLRGLERELNDVTRDNEDRAREIERLRGRVARLKSDPAAIERLARDNLGLVRQSEVVFQFPSSGK